MKIMDALFTLSFYQRYPIETSVDNSASLKE